MKSDLTEGKFGGAFLKVFDELENERHLFFFGGVFAPMVRSPKEL
jgi:hypothetical protein